VLLLKTVVRQTDILMILCSVSSNSDLTEKHHRPTIRFIILASVQTRSRSWWNTALKWVRWGGIKQETGQKKNCCWGSYITHKRTL